MNITALFTHKHTHEILTLGFEATTQDEFNHALSGLENEAARQMRQFTTEVETPNGDDAQLEAWFKDYEPQGPTFQRIPRLFDAWGNDHLQFTRLLRELDLAGAYTPAVMARLTESMNCEEAGIDQLIERVTLAFDEYQARPAPGGAGYAVRWCLDVSAADAATPEQAAAYAQSVVQDPTTAATGFFVYDMGSGEEKLVDLECLPDNAWKVVDYTGDEHRAYEEQPDYYTVEKEARDAYQKLADAGAPVRLYGGYDDGEEVGEWEIIEMANEEKLAEFIR